jgi:hypothetical protein
MMELIKEPLIILVLLSITIITRQELKKIINQFKINLL